MYSCANHKEGTMRQSVRVEVAPNGKKGMSVQAAVVDTISVLITFP
jgi:hypothetical protein